MTSAGHRRVFRLGPLALRTLLGLAWLRRSSLRQDEDDILVEHKLKQEHGFALMAGAGVAVRVGEVTLAVDLRAYPTWWLGIDGSRVVVRGRQAVSEPIADSPGGIPRTVTASLAIGW